jgi:hypothetical protein
MKMEQTRRCKQGVILVMLCAGIFFASGPEKSRTIRAEVAPIRSSLGFDKGRVVPLK